MEHLTLIAKRTGTQLIRQVAISEKEDNILLILSRKYLLVLILSVLLISSTVYALEPPTNEQIEQYKRDGTFEKRIAQVKRMGNDKVSANLVAQTKYKLKKMQLKMQDFSDDKISRVLPAPPVAWQGMQTKGTAKMFVLLIEFPDYPHKESKESIQNKLFGDGSAESYPYESLRNFYRRASYNQLNITGEALGWYKTAYNRSAVASTEAPGDSSTDAARENLMKEALAYFDSQGYDFSQYDGNNDGYIDYFAIIWTGPDGGWGNFWWAYKFEFVADTSFKLDGKTFKNYSWQWETDLSQEGTEWFTPKTIIHETGHGLGLPDYYDYKGVNGGDGGLDMMDGAWGDHNCFSKFLLDWITPEAVSGNGKTFSLNASGVSQDAVLVMPAIATGDAFNEFFMVQNRYRVGNDDVKNPGRIYTPALPNDGLLIWHVDSTLDNTGQDFKYNNSATTRPYHKLLRLMEADGLEQIEKGDRANAGDYFNKANKFTLNSIPNSSNYLNAKTGIAVKNISDSGPVMNCSIAIGFCAPPTINTYESATVLSSITLLGTMAASTTEIFINGSTNGVTLYASSWEAPVTITSGLNTFEVSAGTGTIESLTVTAKITQKDFEIRDDALGVLLTIPQGSSNITPIVTPEVYSNSAILGVRAPTSALAGDIINFKSNVTSFSKLITITMRLNNLSINPSVYFWDETSGAWNNSGISITTKTSSSITFTVNKLGIFGIFDSADSPQNILIYPNPAKISAGQNVTFNGLKGNEIIRIFTTAGEFVNYYDNNSLKAPLWAWDLKNYSGSQVVQNIYAYVITNDAGQKKVGKIAVIK